MPNLFSKLKTALWSYPVLGALILFLPALKNGFPFSYLDTGAYIHAGMTWSVLFDRPIFYGIWIFLTSLGQSVWLTAIWQVVLTSLLINRILQLSLKDRYSGWHLLAICGLLSLFSGAAINAAMLLPDAFTPIMAMSALLYLADKSNRKWYFLLLCIATPMHNSHWLILAGFLVSYLWMGRKNIGLALKLSAGIWLALVCSLLISCTAVYLKYGQFKPAPASTFFMMGRLAETGLLGPYLAENCPALPAGLCKLHTALPMGASEFIWRADGILYTDGGYFNNETAYQSIVKGILKQPDNLLKFVYRSFWDGLHQLSFNRLVLHDASPNYETFLQLERHFYTDAQMARYALQAYGTGDFSWTNPCYYLLLLFSAILLLGKRAENSKVATLLLGLWLFVVLNAFVTATFGNVDSRLQARMAWLILVSGYIMVLQMSWFKIGQPNQKRA